MCELDYFIYGMYGVFGALGSYIIYKKTKLKFQIDEKPIETDGVKSESTGLAEKS
jgi:hypothetical protein